MATSQLWRIVPGTLLAALAAILSIGLTIGDAQAKCPGAAQRAAAQVAIPALKDQPPVIERVGAAAIPIWRTISIGNYKGVDAVRAAVEAAPCPVVLGDWADEILGRPTFPFSRKPTELDLVVVSVADLGFGDQGAPLRDIYARALATGLELCPAEAGPVLRLNYLDQPPGEFLHLAMLPVARYSGELVDFILGNGGTDLMLIGGDARPETMMPGVVRLVFVQPRPDAIGSASPGTDASLAKR
jgi:hypothetical protein